MSITSKTPVIRTRYQRGAYKFVDTALRFTQQHLRRNLDDDRDEESAHITGQELLNGIRELALREFGLMTTTVLRHWGIRSTEDFGRIVFDFIDRGAMRKTDSDRLSDFFEVYDFEEVFDRQYQIDVSAAFRN